jgi:hypothetical protein
MARGILCALICFSTVFHADSVNRGEPIALGFWHPKSFSSWHEMQNRLCCMPSSSCGSGTPAHLRPTDRLIFLTRVFNMHPGISGLQGPVATPKDTAARPSSCSHHGRIREVLMRLRGGAKKLKKSEREEVEFASKAQLDPTVEKDLKRRWKAKPAEMLVRVS